MNCSGITNKRKYTAFKYHCDYKCNEMGSLHQQSGRYMSYANNPQRTQTLASQQGNSSRKITPNLFSSTMK